MHFSFQFLSSAMSPISLDSLDVATTKSSWKTCQQSSFEALPTADNQRILSKHDKLFIKRVVDKFFQTKSLHRLHFSDLQRLEKVRQKLSCTHHSHDKFLTKSVINKLLRLESSNKYISTDLRKLEKIKQKLLRNRPSKLNIRNRNNAKLDFKAKKKMAGRKRKQPEDEIPSKNEYVAMDCEFVGVGPKRHSALGKTSFHFNSLTLPQKAAFVLQI